MSQDHDRCIFQVMQMKQLNARKCSTEKPRTASVRPLSPSSVNSGYSLYSTDTEDQVMSTHRGLDRCAALLANMMENEQIENVPTKLERGVGSKRGGMPHSNQQSKQTSKQRGPVTKTKVKTLSTQKKPVHSGPSKDKKQTGRRSSNQKLVSSTPNQSAKHTKVIKREKKQGSDRLNSKDTKRGRTGFSQEKDVKEKPDPRIPVRVSPGNKENYPLPMQHPNREGVQQRFIETYDVTPQVLNENGITKTRMRAEVVKNPALRQHHAQTGKHFAAPSNERPHCNAATSKQASTLHRLNMQQIYVGERDHVMLHPQHVGIMPKGQCVPESPQKAAVQAGKTTNIGNHIDPNAQPWVSHIDMDPSRITSEIQHSRREQHDHHPQHQQYPYHQQQQDQQQHHISDTRDYAAECQMAASTREMSQTVPGLQPSRNLDSLLQSSMREGPANGGIVGPVQTTQSILRDLVGKLQKMNESQIQAPQAQLTHPSPGSGIAQKDVNYTHRQVEGLTDPSPGSGITQEVTNHTQNQMGHGSNHVSNRGVDRDVRRQEQRLQDTLLLDRNLPKHNEIHCTKRSRNHETGPRANPVRTYNADLQRTDDQLEPVRDTGKSCDQQSTNQSPGNVMTQMQRISGQGAEDPLGDMLGIQGGKKGNHKLHTSPKSQHNKDDVGVQTPPSNARPPAVVTGDKGSNALWDQVRTLKYITRELQSADLKNADVQTQELLTELDEVIETLPFTSLDRDLQTEINLALQPIRSENSQLRRRLRIANQQLRQIQVQAQAKDSSQSGVSLEVLTLQSLNVNLQKQVEELQCETDKQTRDMTDLRTSLDALKADKHNMQDVFTKMDIDIKEKRKGWTVETSTLRQEITRFKSQLESERLRVASVEKDKEILRRSIEQRDSEIKRLQQMTRNMQEILSSVVPGKSLQSSLPGESKESRLENWLEQHQSSLNTPSSITSGNDMPGSHHQMASGQGHRSPHDPMLTTTSSSSSSSRGGHSIKHSSPSAVYRDDWRGMQSSQQSSLDDRFAGSGGGEKQKPSQFEEMFGVDGRCDDLDSTLIEDTLDGDGTAYMSFADPHIGSRKPWISHASLHRPPPSGAGGMPSWVEKELLPATLSMRQHIGNDKSVHISDKLGRMVNVDNKISPPSYHGRTDSGLRSREEHGRVPERELGRIFNAAEVGSVVSESTISSIASQYEAQFQVGLSKLDDDIAKLQENLKGLVKR